MLFIPVAVDVPIRRLPWMNCLLLLVLFLVFLWQLENPAEARRHILNIAELGNHIDPDDVLTLFFYDPIDEHPLSFITHCFMHNGWLHLFGNLIFMWVFGNAVCAKVGNLKYAALWMLGGLFTSLYDIFIGDIPTLGASGAITFVAGFFIAFYLLNDVRMFYFVIVRAGTFEMSSYWLIIIYAALDLLGIIGGSEGVNNIAQFSGYLGGFALGILSLKLGWFHAESQERSFFDVLRGDKDLAPLPVRAEQSELLRRQLYVHLGNGEVKRQLVARLEPDMLVSEDAASWTTLRDWKRDQKKRAMQPL